MLSLFWHCPNGHILGLVEKTTRRGCLLVFRAALEPAADLPIDLAAEVVGEAVIYCSICGAPRRWRYADYATRRLFKRRQKL